MCDIADKILQPRGRGRRRLDNNAATKVWVGIIVTIFLSFGLFVFGTTERAATATMIEIRSTQKDNNIRIDKLEDLASRNAVTYDFIREELKSIKRILDAKK